MRESGSMGIMTTCAVHVVDQNASLVYNKKLAMSAPVLWQPGLLTPKVVNTT